MAGKLEIPAEGSFNKTEDPKIKKTLETLNALLDTNDLIPNSSLAGNKFTWYTPKIIDTEESRTNVAYGTLATPDEIKSVVLPENGLILLGYIANVKSSVSAVGRAAIFLGANQLKLADVGDSPAVQEKATEGTVFTTFTTTPSGLTRVDGSGTPSTTGQLLAAGPENYGGFSTIFAAAGTYDISVRFKASSGSVTAKERKLWVAVLG